MAKHRIFEVKNSKQTAKILVPSNNALLKEVMKDAFLLEVFDNENVGKTEETVE